MRKVYCKPTLEVSTIGTQNIMCASGCAGTAMPHQRIDIYNKDGRIFGRTNFDTPNGYKANEPIFLF